MPPKALARAGLVVALFGLLVLWVTRYWRQSLVPLDVPITISEGSLKTPAFQIKLPGTYGVWIDTDGGYRWDIAGCDPQSPVLEHWQLQRDEGWFRTRWVQLTNDILSHEQESYADAFEAKRGRYFFDLQLSRSTGCLNTKHARLRIGAWSSAYEDWQAILAYISLSLFGTGIVLGLKALFRWLRRDSAGRPLRILPELALRSLLPPQRHRSMPLITNLPGFGLLWGCVLFLVPLFAGLLGVWHNVGGIMVRLPETSAVLQKSPWTQTLSVYVDARRRFYVNGELVPREKLRERLLEELKHRAVWTAYFEADPNGIFMDSAYAIGTMKDLRADVVWITPQMREELNRAAPR
jgi:biopolymer transport protein ExbD